MVVGARWPRNRGLSPADWQHFHGSSVSRFPSAGCTGSVARFSQRTLGAAAALAALTTVSLCAGSAQAYVVTVNSIQYDVTTFTGSYSGDPARFSSTYMPWHTGDSNNTALVSAFAAAVGNNLGTGLNGSDGLYFAYYQIGTGANDSVGICINGGSCPTARGNSSSYVYAQVLPAAAPVPAPLPLFGAGAAFGFSRQLRKRIQVARKPLATSQPRA